MHDYCRLCAAATTLDHEATPDYVESKATNQEFNVEMPQFGALDNTVSKSVDSTVPYVAPLPKVRSPGRSSRKTLNDPTPPGTKSVSTSKKKSSLPRVATLTQPSPKSKVESKNSPPPFRAGGKVGTGWNRETSGIPTRRTTPTRGSSSASIAREASKVSSSSLATRSSTMEAMILPRRASPRTGSRRAIVKPPESIKRAIKESQELSKRDSLDTTDDADMQNLREILNDIKTIKSELGVESSKAEEGAPAEDNDEVAESALRPDSSTVDIPEVEKIEPIQSEDVTVSYMTDAPVELDPDEAEGPCREPEEPKEETAIQESPLEQETAMAKEQEEEEQEEETKERLSSGGRSSDMKKESSSCLCCLIM